MSPEFHITTADVKEAIQDGRRMVQIKCINCPKKGHIVQNSLGKIKDYIISNFPSLLNCPLCGTVTEIDPKDLPVIRNILCN